MVIVHPNAPFFANSRITLWRSRSPSLVMTCFVISHNLQVHAQAVPSLAPEVLAEALRASSQYINTAEALDHPHWLVRINLELDAIALAQELPRAWRAMRKILGHGADHELLAL